jgi:DNA processing protein
VLRGLRAAGAPRALLDRARRLARDEVPDQLQRAGALGWRWVVPGDGDYPPLLSECTDPPLGLFVRGTAVDWTFVVAVVGSRRATAYGRQVAAWIGEELAAAGVVVASGMARGVDAAAHRGALTAGGPTAAVWGTGPGRVYPAEHADLAEHIVGHGVLMTEYPPGTPPRRRHFPERNRILAGMARAVIVVEAAGRSGALITARLAVDEGREVLAVPGSVLSDLSVGPNGLLRLGAQPMVTPRDVLELLGVPLRDHDNRAGNGEVPLPDGEQLTVDEVARREGTTVQEAAMRLLELEIEGRVERQPDGRYSRRRPGRAAPGPGQ